MSGLSGSASDEFGTGQNTLSADFQVTVEDPPEVNGWSRRSFWVKALEAARRHDSWVRVHRLYTEKTASQIASDLRSAHRRTDNNVRVRGVLPGERWDARWGASPDGPNGQYAIWVRYLGIIDEPGAKSSTKSSAKSRTSGKSSRR